MLFPERLRPPEGIKALVFDCDGTLADTFAAHYRALRAALKVYGVDFAADFYAARVGLSRTNLLQAVREGTGIHFDADAVAAQNAPLFLDNIEAVKAIPQTEALVRHYHGALKLGVCSGGQKAIVTATLKAIGLYEMFDTIVAFEDTGVGKPAPDLYLEACSRLGVAPREAHAYEDSDEGMAAARAAGLSVSDVRPFYVSDPTRW